MELLYRAARADDLDALHALHVAGLIEGGRPMTISRDDVEREWFSSDRFDASTMSRVATLGGELIAYVGFEVHQDQMHSEGFVAPLHRACGIGTELLRWLVDRARADERVATLWGWIPAERKDGVELFENERFAHVRSFISMLHRDPASVRDPIWPEGIERRTFDAVGAGARAAEAWNLSFIDHWNFQEESAEDFAERIAHPEEDTSLWTFAYEGDTLAGFCLVSLRNRDGVLRGALGPIGTSRSHRGIGLGRALLRHSVGLLAARGATEVRLGVDSENPSGAVRLYTSDGFEREREGLVYRFDV